MSCIVFINPMLSLEQRYGELAEAGGTEPPFGLCYLAAVTRKEKYETFIIDAEAEKLEHNETVNLCLKKNPAYIGITATTPAIISASIIAKKIKSLNPTPKIIIGGVHASAIPEETLKTYPDFDFAIIGEGELTIKETLSCLEKKQTLYNIKGLALRKDINIIQTGKRNLIEDLDTLPYPAFDLLPHITTHYRVSTQSVNKLPCVSLITSRGCYGNCTFCDTSVGGKKIRFHSAKTIIRMMKDFKENYGVKSIMFEDDNFLVQKIRLKEFCELYKKENLNITWSCAGRADSIKEEQIKLAKKSGCWQILYGIETGAQKILDFYKKNITLEKIEKTLALTKKHGIFTKGFIIMGNPLETKNTLQMTIDFTKRVALDDISITFFTPFPGSEVYSIVEKYGVFFKNWEKMNCFDIVFIPKGLSAKELIKYQKKAFNEFYFRPRILFGYLMRIRSLSQFKDLLISGLTLIKYIKKKASPPTNA